MIRYPRILYDPKYEGQWEHDDRGMPKAKPDAPEELKVAIEKWTKGIEEIKNRGGEDMVIFP